MEKLLYVVIAGSLMLALDGFMAGHAWEAAKDYQAGQINAVAQICAMKKQAIGAPVSGCQAEAKAYFR